MPIKNLNILFAVKILLTGCVVLFWSFLLGGQLIRALPSIHSVFSGFSWWVDPQEIVNKAQTKNLNHFMPRAEMFTILEGEVVGIKADELESVVLYYEKMTDYLPGMYDPYALLGYAYAQLGRREEAMSLFEKSLTLNPHFMWAHYNLGCLNFQNQNFAGAVKSFQRALNIDPELTLRMVQGSRVFQHILLTTGSQFPTIERLNQRLNSAYLWLVVAYYQQNNFAQTFNVAQLALQKMERNKPIFHYFSGLSAYELGRYQEAVPLILVGLEHFPDAADGYFKAALAFKALGRPQIAARMIQKGSAIENPRDIVDQLTNEMQLVFF